MTSSTIDFASGSESEERPSADDGSNIDARFVSALVGFAVAMSGMSAFRLSVGGLSGHPHFILLPFVALLGHLTIARTPAWVRWFVALSAAMAVLTVVHETNVSFAAKTTLTAVSVLFWSGFFRKVDQAMLGAAGYLAGVAAIVLFALVRNEREFFHGNLVIFDVGNKNSTALYVLPALVCCVLLLRVPDLTRVQRLAVRGAALVVLVGALQTENRASLGGIGIAFIFFVLVGRLNLPQRRRANPVRRMTGLLSIGAGIAGLLAFGPSSFGDAVTGSGRESTAGGRSDIIQAALETFVDNPIAGVGPDTLARLIASSPTVRIQNKDVLATHNVYALILGAFGITGALLAIFVLHRYWSARTAAFDPALVRLALVLFLFEGLFTAEAIFAPPFLFALLLASVAARKEATPVTAAVIDHGALTRPPIAQRPDPPER